MIMDRENMCSLHGIHEEKIDNLKSDMKELKDGQKMILDELKKQAEKKLNEYKTCEIHREELKAYIDKKAGTNADRITKNSGKINTVYSYAAAIVFIFGVAVTIIKLI